MERCVIEEIPGMVTTQGQMLALYFFALLILQIISVWIIIH